MDRNKVLVIAYSFPPAGGGGVQRTLKLVKYLGLYNWDSIVLTVKNHYLPSKDYSLLEEVPSEKNVVRTHAFPMPDQLDNNYKNSTKLWRPCIGKFLKFYRKHYNRYAFPDWYIGWLPFALINGYWAIKRKKIDLIYATGDPFVSFYIAYILSGWTGVSYVLDYRDSWTTHPYRTWYNESVEKKQEELERRFFKKASLVIVAKGSTREELIEKYQEIEKTHICLITNGYDPSDFEGVESARKDHQRFTVTYTGLMISEWYYSPITFLNAINELVNENEEFAKHILVYFIGNINENFKKEIFHLKLDGIVHTLGYLSHRECISYMKSADVLLLLMESVKSYQESQKSAGVIPAKIFEYIYTGNPILLIGPEGFESELILKASAGVIARPNDVLDVKEKLYYLFKKHINGEKNRANLKELEKYSRKYLTKKFALKFNEVVNT